MRARTLAIEFVCFFSFFLFFSLFFFFLATSSIFSRSNAHIQTRRDAERLKGDGEHAVRFTLFVDYRLMFDSGRSFTLEYNLIRSPY